MSDRATGILHKREEGPSRAGGPEMDSAERMRKSETGIHPVIPKIAIGASIWFLLVTWLSFAWDGETDYLLAIVTLFFAFFLVLFLFTTSYTSGDPRWDVRETSFREFLTSDVGIGGGTMRGRDVLIQIALIPVALAFAATLIGLAWGIFG